MEIQRTHQGQVQFQLQLQFSVSVSVTGLEKALAYGSPCSLPGSSEDKLNCTEYALYGTTLDLAA